MGSVDVALGALLDVLHRQVSEPGEDERDRPTHPFRMAVMIIKSLLIVCPLSGEKGKSCLTYRKRGSYFPPLEHLSQFYISLLTIRP